MNIQTETLARLLGLSLVTTLLATFAPGGAIWVNFAFLILSGWKARMVLNGYLGLSETRVWSRGFNGMISVFLIGIGGVYLLPLL